MTGKTVEIRLMMSPEELAELKDGLDQAVRDLSDELEECIEHNSEESGEVASRLKAAQSARCKLSIQESFILQPAARLA